jgi:hypothetical protein
MDFWPIPSAPTGWQPQIASNREGEPSLMEKQANLAVETEQREQRILSPAPPSDNSWICWRSTPMMKP